MDLKQRICDFFSKIRGEKSAKEDDDKGIVESLLETSYRIARPSEVLSPLGMAIAFSEGEPVFLSTDKLKLYALFDKKDKSFIGNCFALKRGDYYYGSLIGGSYVFRCRKNAFNFEKTNDILVPLSCHNDVAYALKCKYNAILQKIKVVSLDKLNFPAQEKIETLRLFDDDVSLDEAFAVCREYM